MLFSWFFYSIFGVSPFSVKD